MRPEMTLVICTRHRNLSLSACLQAVMAMEGVEACQVIVVDNGASADTRRVVDSCARAGHGLIEYVPEPRAGLSRARNRGVLGARGEFVLFTDDDCYPDVRWLQAARAVFRDPAIHYFGGRVLLHDPRDHPITIQESTEPLPLPAHAEIVPGVIHGANMGFRRRVFERIGGFNVLLGAGAPLKCAEDTEFIARASAAGLAGGYFPEPTVRHHHRRNAADAHRLMRDYDVGRGAFFAAMLNEPGMRLTYLRRWRRSFAWRRRGMLMRELMGAARFVAATGLALLIGRECVPRVPSLAT